MKHYQVTFFSFCIWLLASCSSHYTPSLPLDEFQQADHALIFLTTEDLASISGFYRPQINLYLPQKGGKNLVLSLSSAALDTRYTDQGTQKLFAFALSPGCFDGIAAWEIASKGNSDKAASVWSYYNVSEFCVEAGDIGYLGRYLTFNQNGEKSISAVERDISSAFPQDGPWLSKTIDATQDKPVTHVNLDRLTPEQNKRLLSAIEYAFVN